MLITASARSRPDLRVRVCTAAIVACTCPPTTSLSSARLLVRHVHDVHAGLELEELHREVLRPAVSGRRVVQLAGSRFASSMSSRIERAELRIDHHHEAARRHDRTGAKLFTGSNGPLPSAGVVPNEVATKSSV